MDTSQLEVIRQHVEDITADVDVWADRKEPDSRARRYASAAVDAIDSALSELHAIRARLVAEIRTADDANAARADALLADTDAMLAQPTGLMPQWDTPPALRGYGYTLPEDYLRGGQQ